MIFRYIDCREQTKRATISNLTTTTIYIMIIREHYDSHYMKRIVLPVDTGDLDVDVCTVGDAFRSDVCSDIVWNSTGGDPPESSLRAYLYTGVGGHRGRPKSVSVLRDDAQTCRPCRCRRRRRRSHNPRRHRRTDDQRLFMRFENTPWTIYL